MAKSDDAIGMTLRSGTIATAVAAACLAVGAATLFSLDTAFSVVVGGVVGVVNFLVLGWFVRRLFSEERAAGQLTLLAMTKLFALVGGVWSLVASGVADLLPLVAGYGALPIGILASQTAPQPAPKKG